MTTDPAPSWTRATTPTYPEPCCNVPGALVVQTDPDRPRVLVRTCQTCGRRHIEWTVDPVAVGVQMT